MNEIDFYNNDIERDRLITQTRFMEEYEMPIWNEVLKGKEKLTVLDIGCNNGYKTVRRFGKPCFDKILGIDINQTSIDQAIHTTHDSRFFFQCLNLEENNFEEEIKKELIKLGKDAFDIIYVSFVIIFLKDPLEALKKIQGLLHENGVLVIMGPNDCKSHLSPDENHLLEGYLQTLRMDPFAGNRSCNEHLIENLASLGYQNIHLWHEGVTALPKEMKKKKDIYQIFFSYLPQDMEILKNSDKKELYQDCIQWMDHHYPELEALILQEESTVTMGMTFVSCTK